MLKLIKKKIESNVKIKSFLREFVLKTKVDKSHNACIAASNSITILNIVGGIHSGGNLYNLNYCNI